VTAGRDATREIDLDDREIDKAHPFDRPDWGFCAGLLWA
jgi:hypothetical protein